MPDVLPRDILLRFGGRTMQRYGTFVRRVASIARGGEEALETFARADGTSCATYRDYVGKLRTAAANRMRAHMYDLNADGQFETMRVLLEPSDTNRHKDSEDLVTNWFVGAGTPVVTNNFATLGDLVLGKVRDDDAGIEEYIGRNFGAASPWAGGDGDGQKGVAFYWCKPDIESADGNFFNLTDTTAGDAIRWKCTVKSAADGSPIISNITGTLIDAEPWGIASNGKRVYRIRFSSTAITVANAHVMRIMPAGGISAANQGDAIVGGFFLGTRPWPTSHIRTTAGAAVTRAGESCKVVIPFGPDVANISVLAQMPRPAFADLAGVDLIVQPGLVCVGDLAGAGSNLGLYASNASRQGGAVVRFNGGGVQQFTQTNIPAGAELAFSGQFRNLLTAPACALDVGTGLSAFTGATTPLVAFAQQFAAFGTFANNWGDAIDDVLVCAGLFSRSELLAVP